MFPGTQQVCNTEKKINAFYCASVLYTVLFIFKSEGAQMELSWLLGISYHIASLAFWSY